MAAKTIIMSNQLVTDGLDLLLDNSVASYPGTGSIWYDISGNGRNMNLSGTGIGWNAVDSNFGLTGGGITGPKATTGATATLVVWMRTTDDRAVMFTTPGGGGSFCAAYKVDNKEYYSDCGNPTFMMDTVDRPNIYDYLPDGQWHMVEFKDVQMSAWISLGFGVYGSPRNFETDTNLVRIAVYGRNLSAAESLQNFQVTENILTPMLSGTGSTTIKLTP